MFLPWSRYAIGDAVSSRYGKMRAAAGHPAPFKLERVEVGNEEKLLGGVNGYAAHCEYSTQLTTRNPQAVR